MDRAVRRCDDCWATRRRSRGAPTSTRGCSTATESGWTIAGVLGRIPDPGGIDDRIRARIERGVLDLLDDDRRSPALEKLEKLEEKAA